MWTGVVNLDSVIPHPPRRLAGLHRKLPAVNCAYNFFRFFETIYLFEKKKIKAMPIRHT